MEGLYQFMAQLLLLAQNDTTTPLTRLIQPANYNSNRQGDSSATPDMALYFNIVLMMFIDTKLPQYTIRLGVSESKILKLDVRNAKFREEGG
jgi:hypothetical protein